MEKITINSFLDFQYVSAPYFSPCGKYAAFIVQQASLEDNKYCGDIWLLDTETQAVRRLTASGDAKGCFWTGEGKLLFSAARDPKLKKRMDDGELLTCWYEIDPAGGEAALAFTLPISASRLQELSGGQFLVTASFDNNRPPLEELEGEERKKAQEELKNSPCEVFEEAPFWFNGRGYTDGKRSRLYVYNRSSGELKPLTAPWFDTQDSVVAGGKVLYKGVEWRGFREPRNYAGFYLYDIASGETRCVLAPGTIRTGTFGLWDENAAIVAASKGKEYGELQYMDFYTMDLASGELTLLCKYGNSIASSSVGSDARLGGGQSSKVVGDRFYFSTTIGDDSVLRYVDRAGALSEDLTPAGSCDSFDVQGEHTLVCGLRGLKLAELYLDGQQVTSFNDAWLERHSLCVPEYHCFTASDGYEIHGWAMKPAGYEPGKKYPAILHIHGGPRTVFGGVYHHEMQMWANAGYFVFFCNPRGSDGRGDAFGDITGKYGTVDYENIMEFTDEMLRKYPDVDQEKVGVTGGSYGGFMTNWIIGHTKRFAAAASQRSIANWVVFEHTSDIGPSFTANNQGATTRQDVEKLWWHSPLKYADTCTTPTLFIHSDQDYRCWMAEGISMFTALKENGCASRLCLFKGETHELSRSGKPRSRIRRMEEILSWMDHYLK